MMTGPGFLRTSANPFFDPFVRLDESRNRKSGGYGLGLAIAKRIAVWHGGSIEVTHSSMKGSRFSLIIPMTEPGAGAV